MNTFASHCSLLLGWGSLVIETSAFLPKKFHSTVLITQINVYIVDLVVMGFQIRAKNNFRRVSGHDDWPNSGYLGHILFLASQIYKINNS